MSRDVSKKPVNVSDLLWEGVGPHRHDRTDYIYHTPTRVCETVVSVTYQTVRHPSCSTMPPQVMEIPLGGKTATGKSMIVDADVYDRLAARKWYQCSDGYARSKTGTDGKTYRAHREALVDCEHMQEVHHINGDKLDNRRQNLLPIVRCSDAGRVVQTRCTNKSTISPDAVLDYLAVVVAATRDVVLEWERHKTFCCVHGSMAAGNDGQQQGCS